jgi:hypothetical protein
MLGYVYIVSMTLRNGDTAFKVGRTADIEQRLQQLQREFPPPIALRFLCATPHAAAIEEAYHRAMRKHGDRYLAIRRLGGELYAGEFAALASVLRLYCAHFDANADFREPALPEPTPHAADIIREQGKQKKRQEYKCDHGK